MEPEAPKAQQAPLISASRLMPAGDSRGRAVMDGVIVGIGLGAERLARGDDNGWRGRYAFGPRLSIPLCVMATTALEELKLRATHLVVAACCVGLSCYLCFFELCTLTLMPLDNVCFLDLTEAFAVTMQVVLFFATLFIIPVVCLHVWGFVSPGLTAREAQGWALVLSSLPCLQGAALVLSHVLSHLLCVWFLGYSLAAEGGLVLQYLPLISGFVWFKFK